MQVNRKFIEFLWIGIFTVVLGAAVYLKFDGFLKIPGDLGDARLNNYFLENFYRFFSGKAASLWHLDFFYPYPFVLGFSDNLFGSGFIYSFFRVASIESDTAFQLWFLFGYLGNFLAAYCGLRLLSLSSLQAIVGALVFAFALPTSSHALHAQLHYRIGAALSIAYASKFWTQPLNKYLGISIFWLVYQFYCGVYIGFFTLILLLAMMGVSLCQGGWNNLRIWLIRAKAISPMLGLAVLLLLLLFYPYIKAKDLYHLGRDWSEISSMLPRLQSYFIADNLPIWNKLTTVFAKVPMRWEHQMFIGIGPLLLLIWGALKGAQTPFRETFLGLSWATASLIVVSLSVGGLSLWFLLHNLPLFSAIRVVTRLDQVLLFPVAYIIAVGLFPLMRQRALVRYSVTGFICLFLISEWALVPYATSSFKSEWRERMHAVERIFPKDIDPNRILFVAQSRQPAFADELDAMWAASNRGLPTLNGYSGNAPPGVSAEYGTECAEIQKRLNGYREFQHKYSGLPSADIVASRLLPIGFTGACAIESN